MKKCFALLFLLFALPFSAWAGEFKFTKPITIYTSIPTGVPSDIMLRMITGRMEKDLGVTINVIPAAGGAGTTCMLKALAAPHDGYTYVFNGSWKVTAADIFRKEKVAYTDMTPVAVLGNNSYRLVAKEGTYKDFMDFIEQARQNPGKINVGVIGSKTGTVAAVVAHIANLYKVKFNLITFVDNGSVTAATLGGHVNAALFPTTMGGSQVLLNATGYDVPALKGVPTLKDFGKEPSKVYSDMLVMAAADTPEPALEAFSASFYKAMKDYPELDDVALKTDWFLLPDVSRDELKVIWEESRAVITEMFENGHFDTSEEK